MKVNSGLYWRTAYIHSYWQRASRLDQCMAGTLNPRRGWVRGHGRGQKVGWLAEEKRAHLLPREWRPDRSKVGRYQARQITKKRSKQVGVIGRSGQRQVRGRQRWVTEGGGRGVKGPTGNCRMHSRADISESFRKTYAQLVSSDKSTLICNRWGSQSFLTGLLTDGDNCTETWDNQEFYSKQQSLVHSRWTSGETKSTQSYRVQNWTKK